MVMVSRSMLSQGHVSGNSRIAAGAVLLGSPLFAAAWFNATLPHSVLDSLHARLA